MSNEHGGLEIGWLSKSEGSEIQDYSKHCFHVSYCFNNVERCFAHTKAILMETFNMLAQHDWVDTNCIMPFPPFRGVTKGPRVLAFLN
jgi:hypothetical protein